MDLPATLASLYALPISSNASVPAPPANLVNAIPIPTTDSATPYARATGASTSARIETGTAAAAERAIDPAPLPIVCAPTVAYHFGSVIFSQAVASGYSYASPSIWPSPVPADLRSPALCSMLFEPRAVPAFSVSVVSGAATLPIAPLTKFRPAVARNP